MNTNSIITLVIGLIVSLAGMYLCYGRTISFVRAKTLIGFEKRKVLEGICGAFLTGVGFLVLALCVFLNFPEWAEMTHYPETSVFAGGEINYALYMASALVGAIFFGFSATVLNSSLSIKIKKEKLPEEQKKILNAVLYCSIPIVVLSFVLMTGGFGPFITYPLISGIGFGEEGIYWLRAGEYHTGGLHITWYAMCYLIGVAVCYIICDHGLYKKYGKHGIIDTLVLVAFPAGILGGRIWYVVGNWEREFAGRDWYTVFEIWNGGLTILGGAAAGIIAGYIFLRLRRRYVDPRWAVDLIVPTILIAQFIGRWGNFFNCEVYGQVTDVANWSFLPNWLLEQMHVSNSGTLLEPGQIFVPLFLVEGVLNLIGYFIIAKGLPTLFKKRLVPGDLGAAYFIWYGLIRMILEPMRDGNFNMGTDDAWSVVNSLAYILIGIAISLVLHLHDDFVENGRKSRLSFAISGLALAFVSMFMPFLPSVNLVDGGDVKALGGFEVMGYGGEAAGFIVAYVLAGISMLLFVAYLVLAILERQGKLNREIKFPWPSLGNGKGNGCVLPLSDCLGLLSVPFSLVAGIMFFAGTSSLGPSFFAVYESANLSYGFSVAGILMFISALVPLSCLLGHKKANSEARRERDVEEAAL